MNYSESYQVSRAAQTAANIRKEIRKLGINPKGMVRVCNTDYTTDIEINLRGLTCEDCYEIESYINELQDSDLYGFDIIGGC